MNALPLLVDHAVETALEQFAPARLRADELAVTLVDLAAGKNFPRAAHRGDAPIYPASVIKMFYLAATHRWLEDKKISDTPELRRALRDMIVDSSNEATGYVLDVLTDTTSGPELPPAALAAWHEKRNRVNRYFHAVGYPEINANRKTWHDGPYGRDKQVVDQFTPARNCLTTNATARLFVEIATDRCVSAPRCAEMRALLRRDFADPQSTDHQGREFIGAGLPATAKLWSKAGDMSAARHDAAIVELASGKKFVLVIFTTRPEEKGIIPAITRQIVAGF
ncbi:MAG: serine hydrolase [Verrucomicrobiae bacterium]|nr:serine hydrolase [Verrucomicrobiae bacterium]